MSLTVQSPFPVVSTTHFSIGPNERLNVQDFLRDLARSSRAAKAANKLRDQAVVTHELELLTIPQISADAGGSDPLQHPQANGSNDEQSSLLQHSASGEASASDRDISRLTNPFSPKVSNTKSPRIIHTYSRKKKGSPAEALTLEVVPPSSPPNVTASDPQCDASFCSGSQVLAADPATPGTSPNRPTSATSLGAVRAPSRRFSKRKAKRAARGEIVDAEEERPAKNKKRRRRAPVEGLVLLRGISVERPCSSQPEVSFNSVLPAIPRKVLWRIDISNAPLSTK